MTNVQTVESSEVYTLFLTDFFRLNGFAMQWKLSTLPTQQQRNGQ